MPNSETDSNKTNAGEGSGSEVAKVAVRTPPFWPEEPELWFAQMEGQFLLSGITADTTKFYYVISQLEHQHILEVKDIVNAPPTENKFAKLKSELIKRLSASRQKKHRELLVSEEMGDRKPSQFFRHLKTLAGSDVSEDFLKTIWSSRLPQHLQTVVASQPTLSLEQLAELADTVHDIIPTAAQVSAIGSQINQTRTSTTNNGLDELAAQMTELRLEVASLRAQLNPEAQTSRGRTRFNSQNRNRSKSNNRLRSREWNDSYCFYHNKFGAKAYKCTKPCGYPAENFNGSRK